MPALEVAAARGHNLLMVGPPGAGKSMLAARLPSILPPLAPAELLEVSMVASVAGEIEGGALTNRRPFRAPHHSASMPALVGGGLHAQPGEISLAHHGVLFLDELPEFQPQALDSLRQPLETGEVAIARTNHRVTYPARFMLVAAMNPCRCGRAAEPGYACRRRLNARCTADHQARISGPLLDCIDLHIEVPAVTAADLILPPPTEGSREIAERVALARERQAARYAAIGLPHIRSNAAVSGAVLEDVARPDASGLSLLREAADAMRLSARGYHRVLRVARTLADLDGADKVGRVHLAEALSYRARRRNPTRGVKPLPSAVADAPRSANADRGQKFLARLGMVAKDAEHAARHHGDAGLVHAAGGHALVRRLGDHRDAMRLEHGIETRRDLGGHLLLDLQPPRIDVDQPRQLGNSDHAVARQIADVHAADDRRHVVLAMRLETDVAQHHHLVVAAGLLEGPLEIVARIILVTGKPFLISAHDAPRRGQEPFPVWIVAGPTDERAHGALRFLAGRPRGRGRACPRAFRIHDFVHPFSPAGHRTAMGFHRLVQGNVNKALPYDLEMPFYMGLLHIRSRH